MTEYLRKSIEDRLSDKEQRAIGLKLIDMGLAGILTSAPAGADDASVALREIRPTVVDIQTFSDAEFSGSREEYLIKLRIKCDQLPDFGVGFSDYIFDLIKADWKGHEDSRTREKTNFRWKVKSILLSIRNNF